MNWIKVSIETVKNGVDVISSLIDDFGISGVEISDKEDFQEFLENNRKYWDYVDEELEALKDKETTVTFYLSEDQESILEDIKNEVMSLKTEGKELGTLNVITENVKDEDWSENWKKYFKPIEIGENILVCPQWEEVPETNRKVLLINSGMSFGTGTHESTRMCMEELEKSVKNGMTVTDLGCGSGILSVLALILGAEKVYSVDIDEEAVNVTYSNLSLNNFDESKLSGFAGDITKDENLYKILSDNKADIVVANIVADVIIMLSKYVKAFMKDDGLFICSGIIKERTDEVVEAIKSYGFVIRDVRTEGEWSVVVAK